LRILPGEGLEDSADGDTNCFDRSRVSEEMLMLEFGEKLFDAIEVGEYFGRKKSLAPAARMS
jgi:hypothetical protein